ELDAKFRMSEARLPPAANRSSGDFAQRVDRAAAQALEIRPAK
ncbi:MAG: hypothetical protein JWN44_3897, partial [Myxococcales bacterium]|nr:hypothetical protein [Myxococcales bacterium]